MISWFTQVTHSLPWQSAAFHFASWLESRNQDEFFFCVVWIFSKQLAEMKIVLCGCEDDCDTKCKFGTDVRCYLPREKLLIFGCITDCIFVAAAALWYFVYFVDFCVFHNLFCLLLYLLCLFVNWFSAMRLLLRHSQHTMHMFLLLHVWTVKCFAVIDFYSVSVVQTYRDCHFFYMSNNLTDRLFVRGRW